MNEDIPCLDHYVKVDSLDLSGFRALDALLRPFPISIHGHFEKAEFQLRRKFYKLKIIGKANSDFSNGKTYIFLPSYHFPIEYVTIKASSGSFSYDSEHQVLIWSHNSGLQYICLLYTSRCV